MGWFLKTILIVVGIYMIGKAVIRGILSCFLGDVEEQRSRRHQDEMAQRKKKQEGHITIKYQPQSNKHIGKNEGDYVDFEEVK